MPKAISTAQVVAHLQQRLKGRRDEAARERRLHGKAASLGLSIMSAKTLFAGEETLDGYILFDKTAAKPLTGPDGKTAYLPTLDDIEAVLKGIK
jgi:hypothetical protein